MADRWCGPTPGITPSVAAETHDQLRARIQANKPEYFQDQYKDYPFIRIFLREHRVVEFLVRDFFTVWDPRALED